MARMKIESGESIERLIEDLEEPVEAREFRMNIKVDNFTEYGNALLRDLEEYAQQAEGWNIAPDNHEGIWSFFR